VGEEGKRVKDSPFDTDDEDELGLGGDVIGAFLLAQTSKTDLFTLCIAVLLDVRLGTLEYDATLLFLSLYNSTSACSFKLQCLIGFPIVDDSDPKDG